MREVVFKGKRTDNDEWVEGAYMPHYYSTRYGKVAAIFTNDDVLCKTYRFPVDPDTVGQYTGLKDKNGKRIFEGDIVKCSHSFITANAEEAEIKNPRKSYGKEIEKMTLVGFRCRYWRNYAVSFHDGRIRGQNGSDSCYLKQSYIKNHEIEVIGNIHDNGVEELNGD